jgi:PAS domain S-box-containing protein
MSHSPPPLTAAGPPANAHDDRELLRAAFERATIGMAVTDMQGRFLQVNAAYATMCGYTEQQLLGLDYEALTHPDDRERHAGLLRRMIDGELQHFVIEKRCVRGDGAVIWVRNNISLAFAPDGEPMSIVALSEDISEARRLLEAERTVCAETERAAQRTELLFDITSALASATTEQEVAEVVIQRAARSLGAVAGMIALRREGQMLEIISSHSLPRQAKQTWGRCPLDTDTPLAEAVRTGTAITLAGRAAMWARYPERVHDVFIPLGIHALNATPLRVDGRVIGAILFLWGAPRESGEGELALFGALADQCVQALERGRLYEAERRARGDAERANLAKSRFLATMSHELRTPLNAIGGYAELLDMGLRGPVTAAQRADLARIRHSEQHLLGVIDDILDFAQLEAGQTRFELTDVPVAEALTDMETLIAPQLRDGTLSYRCQISDTTLAVRADRDRLQQVLANLLTNATKFTDGPGAITVIADATADRVRIAVQDTGIGIPPNRLQHIFDPFVQVDPRLARSREGAGLGLAISRDLARKMSGDIQVESELGVGSTFSLVLPRGATAARRGIGSGRSQRRSPGGTKA